MALRASVPEVCAIIETDLTGTAVLPFLKTANALVEEHLILSPAISDELLTQIEMYLAAHFITLWDPRTSKESADGVSFTYEGKTGEGLDSSRYGQMAKTLDPSGVLATIDKPERMAWLARAANETDVENL